ncbi:hypothetical protein J0S82_020486 [Galemys pyrenaicus]|uniref:Uncharacterized protein n=1 Tax=Galemys pyrenaicus TaxID=202257 RepID=A0A8J6AIF5_GALPY|nr:hypothetical protein J0S82_020486 [Galemys pyrenaicus]
MKLRRRGLVWKEQKDYFSLSWRMRSAPNHPSSRTPPPSAHAQSGSNRLLKAQPLPLRQCAQQRTLRPADLGEPAASLSSTDLQLSEPWRQWLQPRLNCSLLAGTSSACCCRCSGTPCRSWRTQCRGPGGRCWESAGSEPPTEAPAPSPGRPCQQVLLCIPASMGASAAQEWGVPCALSSEEHLPRHHVMIWTKSGQRHPSPAAWAVPTGPTMEIQTTTPASRTDIPTSPAEALNLMQQRRHQLCAYVAGLEGSSH